LRIEFGGAAIEYMRGTVEVEWVAIWASRRTKRPQLGAFELAMRSSDGDWEGAFPAKRFDRSTMTGV
jgi:hypothetical protein